MFVHESVRRCEVCDAVTPHSKRRVAGGKALAVALASLAAALALLGARLQAWLGAALLLYLALLAWLRDRESCRHVECERCRARARAAVRETKPTLDGRSEIGIG